MIFLLIRFQNNKIENNDNDSIVLIMQGSFC